MVTTALRTPFERLRNGWAWGFQSLKSPTTDTAPAGSVPGSTNVTRTVPARVGLSTLINCCSFPPLLAESHALTLPRAPGFMMQHPCVTTMSWVQHVRELDPPPASVTRGEGRGRRRRAERGTA